MQLSDVFRVASTFLRAEAKNVRRYDLPVRDRLRLYRHRFTSERGVLYELDSHPLAEYLSDASYVQTKRIDRPHHAGLANKVFFHELLSRTHPEDVPGLLGVTRDGALVDGPFDIRTVEDLYAHATDERVVVKPIQATGGAGVHVLRPGDGGPQLDGEAVTEADLAEFLAGRSDSVVTPYVYQAEYADEIYPDAANTVRILTMVDPDSGSPFVAAAIHRFGGGQSGAVDNWSSGGMVVALDVETGELGEVAVSPTNGSMRRVTDHPDTGVRVSGKSVPAWDRIVEGILDVAGEYGWLWPYVGWDVVVTDDDGSFQILEGNFFPHVPMMQIHGPLLSDPRVRRFYEHHGVL